MFNQNAFWILASSSNLIKSRSAQGLAGHQPLPCCGSYSPPTTEEHPAFFFLDLCIPLGVCCKILDCEKFLRTIGFLGVVLMPSVTQDPSAAYS